MWGNSWIPAPRCFLPTKIWRKRQRQTSHLDVFRLSWRPDCFSWGTVESPRSWGEKPLFWIVSSDETTSVLEGPPILCSFDFFKNLLIWRKLYKYTKHTKVIVNSQKHLKLALFQAPRESVIIYRSYFSHTVWLVPFIFGFPVICLHQPTLKNYLFVSQHCKDNNCWHLGLLFLQFKIDGWRAG